MRALERAVFLVVGERVSLSVPPSTFAKVECACSGNACGSSCAAEFVYPDHDYESATVTRPTDVDQSAPGCNATAMTFRVNVSSPDRAFILAAYDELMTVTDDATATAATVAGSAARGVFSKL
eukprot:5379078-Prymnesium_polylepis.1